MRLTKGPWSILVGTASVGIPVVCGMSLFALEGRVDARDCVAALIAIATGGVVAGLLGLRKGPVEAGRASTLGCVAWVVVTLLTSLAVHPSHPGAALAMGVVVALSLAAFGTLMGLVVHGLLVPCLRKL
jgi:hypothetical protein